MLADFRRIKHELNFKIECIVVDGGSSDATLEICKNFSVRVYGSQGGRGVQLATGAEQARGDVLLFLHADSKLTARHCEVALQIAQNNKLLAGGFHLEFVACQRFFRFAEWLNRVRFIFTRVIYGDHGFFITRLNYRLMGGFADMPLFEDVEFCRRLRPKGCLQLFKPPLSTSIRRFEKNGVLRTYMIMLFLHIAFRAGVSPMKLAKLYKKSVR